MVGNRVVIGGDEVEGLGAVVLKGSHIDQSGDAAVELHAEKKPSKGVQRARVQQPIPSDALRVAYAGAKQMELAFDAHVSVTVARRWLVGERAFDASRLGDLPPVRKARVEEFVERMEREKGRAA